MSSSQSLCVCCSGPVEQEDSKSFEQRLVDDQEFCLRCWNEIITFVSDDELLPSLIDAFANAKKGY